MTDSEAFKQRKQSLNFNYAENDADFNLEDLIELISKVSANNDYNPL